jgi:hypothetical protein
MGTIGDCYDNGMMESSWGRMQTELLDRRRWKTRIELANAIFDYLEIFHNRQRRHSSLGMLTPNEYEMPPTNPIRGIEPAVPAPRNPANINHSVKAGELTAAVGVEHQPRWWVAPHESVGQRGVDQVGA